MYERKDCSLRSRKRAKNVAFDGPVWDLRDRDYSFLLVNGLIRQLAKQWRYRDKITLSRPNAHIKKVCQCLDHPSDFLLINGILELQGKEANLQYVLTSPVKDLNVDLNKKADF